MSRGVALGVDLENPMGHKIAVAARRQLQAIIGLGA